MSISDSGTTVWDEKDMLAVNNLAWCQTVCTGSLNQTYIILYSINRFFFSDSYNDTRNGLLKSSM